MVEYLLSMHEGGWGGKLRWVVGRGVEPWATLIQGKYSAREHYLPVVLIDYIDRSQLKLTSLGGGGRHPLKWLSGIRPLPLPTFW